MSSEKLIFEKAEFDRLRLQCDRIVDESKRLPDYVFRRIFDKYVPIEFGHIGRPEFANFLENLSKCYGDNRVNYMNIDPDPVEYYFNMHGFYGAASFSPSELADAYIPTMSRGGRADSFLYRGGDVGVFWGTSLEWSVYFDRISWEMAIISTSNIFSVVQNSDFSVITSSAIRDYIHSQYHADPAVSDKFGKSFLANYA